jgi:hypothetical protein
MTTLDASFEDDLREALLDDVEGRARAVLADRLDALANGALLKYGRTNDYNVRPIIEASEITVTRDADRVTIRAAWPEPALYFEYGTSDHTITPTNAEVLSFVWVDPPQWVREEFDQARDTGGRYASGWRVFFPEVEVSGLPEARFIRDALRQLRADLT